jgi:uncharacterized Zn finger protein (UPF0148 family)
MTVKCPDCGKPFEDGTMFCDQCGSELPQRELKIDAPEEAESPEPVEEEVDSDPIPSSDSKEPATISDTAKLVVTRGAQPGKEYSLFAGENEIGRWDEEEGYTPHIDLTDQDMEGYVHRRHAMIRFDGDQWWLEHLRQPPSNPTMIRGRGKQLEVGEPIPLEDGDEVVVARVILKFVIE